MKKIFFIICLTMLCYSCIDKNNETENNKNSYFVQHHNEHIELKIDTINNSKYDNVIKIDTANIKKRVDRYIKKRVFIHGYRGVEEVTLKKTINTYEDYDYDFGYGIAFCYHEIINLGYHSDMWEGGEIDWTCPDISLFVNEHDWVTSLLHSNIIEGKFHKIDEESFTGAYVCECIMSAVDEYNYKYTIIMNIIFDEDFKVNLISELKFIFK